MEDSPPLVITNISFFCTDFLYHYLVRKFFEEVPMNASSVSFELGNTEVMLVRVGNNRPTNAVPSGYAAQIIECQRDIREVASFGGIAWGMSLDVIVEKGVLYHALTATHVGLMELEQRIEGRPHPKPLTRSIWASFLIRSSAVFEKTKLPWMLPVTRR